MSSTASLLSVFNALPDATLLLTAELRIEAASDTYLAATLARREAIVGRLIFEAFPDNPATPEARAVHNLRTSLEQVLATGQPHTMARQRYDVPDPARPGQFVARYWLPRNTPVLDGQGRVSHLLHTVTDVTPSAESEARQQLRQLNRELESRVQERTHALEQARQEAGRQRQRLENLLLQAPAAICIFSGPELVYELVNPVYQQLFPGRRLLGYPVLEALPEVLNQPIWHTLRQVYHTGQAHTESEVLVQVAPHEGSPLQDFYFNYLFQSRTDENGHVDGVVVFAFDITQQVRAQRASAAAAHQLRLLTDALPVLIGYLDQQERYQFANHAYQAWFDQEPETLLGRPVREVIGEQAYAGVQHYIKRALAGEQLSFTACMPYREGFTKHIRTSYVPDIQGQQVVGFYTLVSDVTQEVLAREQVQGLNDELAAINEELEASNEELRLQHTELEQTQQALLEEAQRRAQERETFYQVFEQTPALIALLRDEEHRFEYVNQAYQELFPGRQLVGLTLAEALPETVEQGFQALMDKVYQTGETFYGNELLLRMEQPAGQQPRDIYFTFTYQAYREKGALAGVSIFAFEVTGQVQARQQHEVEREMERQRLLSLFAEAPAGICILAGPELVYEFVNLAYQLLLPGRELPGRSIFAVLPEIRGTSVEAIMRNVYASGQTHEEQDLLIPLKQPGDDGLENRYFSFVCQARRNEQEQIDGLLVFVFEVTAQIQVTEALRESEARFRIMADAAPNQVWAVNPDATIRYANQAFLDFVGVSLEEYTATGWAYFVPPEELKQAQYTLETAIRTRSLYMLEHRMRRHDGQYRWLLAQGAPSFYPNGELYGYVGSAIDITELKQTNQQLTRTNQDLDNFVYAASHDLKQPVNNLTGLFEEVCRSSTFADPAEEQLLVPLVHEALQQLSSTIDDLAALGQAQQTRVMPTELVSLADLMEEVVNTLEPQVRAARARITTDFTSRPALSFARANLRTILLNLVGNSLKYADPTRPARIHVSVWVELGQPVLIVEDNGLGFDAVRHGAELFHLFQRLHTHTAGTGVGLYLVHRIVQANGGTIEVDSQPGEGATFRIRFGAA
ncbi:PAS domain-containing protein [Hymenobacter swuensis]|uniref:PAS domain-containing protein n=1 Tax=Hymenobacter swuensis TaxID=1446467 RepID=UPI0004AD9D81|nr:PAS domain-containing protein [Hymenobacter swuensis]